MHTHKAVSRVTHMIGVCFTGSIALLVAAHIVSAREANKTEVAPEKPRVTSLLSTTKTIIGEDIAYPPGKAKLTAVVVALKPGQSTGWHTHGIPTFGYVLEGELTVDYGPHGKRVYKAGNALAEAIHAPHDGTNTGKGVMRVLAVFMGAEGLPVSKKADKP